MCSALKSLQPPRAIKFSSTIFLCSSLTAALPPTPGNRGRRTRCRNAAGCGGCGSGRTVIDQIKGDKVIHFVKRRRKHGSQRTKGHRQQLTLVKITDILEKGADKSGVKAAIGAGSAPAEAAPAKVAPAPKKAAKKAEAKAEAKAEPMAETKKAAPKKAAGAPAVADDLSAITEVGPAAVKKLVAAGIKTYAQLGGMSDDDIAAIGTIKIKPEWVAQANDLAKC